MIKYNNWINKHYRDWGTALGNCQEAVKKINKEFPELTIKCGYVHFAFNEKRMHWWCIDNNGNIIDPTGHQYPGYLGEPILDYEEVDDNSDEKNYPRERCYNCGEYYFKKSSIMHTEQCHKEYCNYLNKRGK